MRFDLSGETPGEWFKFFRSEIKENGETVFLEPEAGAGRVRLRIATPEVIESIQAQTRKKVAEFVYNKHTRAMDRWTGYDQTPEQEKRERELIWDHAIQGWEGMLDVNGIEIPCMLENKLKLMNVPQFARFVGRCLQLITGANAGAAEEAEKNS
jgi:hypothetical protein